jgi:hypothetical protein
MIPGNKIKHNTLNGYVEKGECDEYCTACAWDACSKAWAKWILVYCSEADLGCEHADFKALNKLAEEKDNG